MTNSSLPSTTTSAYASPARSLGRGGPAVFPLALGCMGMSGMYGATSDDESLRTIHDALDAGVTLFDTGDFYGMGHNEMLLGRAMKGRRDQAIISVKFGALRGPDGSWIGFDARPVAVKNAVAHSLTRLGVSYIDICRPARLDPAVPIEDTIGAIADLVKAGYVRHVGLSEVGADTIRRAHSEHPIADLQIEYSLVSRGVEGTILPVLRELGIGVTAYGVLSRGLLAGSVPTDASDFRSYLPRFTGEFGERNREMVSALGALAARRSVSMTHAAIAWVLSRGDDIVPVIGARTPLQLTESLGVLHTSLTADDFSEMEEVATNVRGTRYDAHQMQALDSERVI